MNTYKTMKLVHFFKTNVDKQWDADMLCDLVQTEFTVERANFDLQDCDKIFRVESTVKVDDKVIALLHLHGFACEELPD